MDKILYVRELTDKGFLCLGASVAGEPARFTVSRAAYTELGSPAVGAELDGDVLSAIRYADEEYRARRTALAALAASDKSLAALKRRLISKGIRREIVDSTCSEMVALGYVDESRQIERLVLLEVERLHGPRKILCRLVARGYSASLVRSAITRLSEEGEIDIQDCRERLLSTLPPDATYEERHKLLYKHGFESSHL